MRIKILALPLLVALAGCAPEVDTTVYMQDVLEVHESGQPISVPAILRIPQPSEDSCNEDLSVVVAAFSKSFPVEGTGRCVTVEFNNFAEITTTMQILPASTDVSADGSVLALRVDQNPTDVTTQSLVLTLEMRRSVDQLTETLKSASPDFAYLPDFDPPMFRIAISNDLRDDVKLVPFYVFVDGRPGLPTPEDTVNLARRDEVMLTLSNVASARLALPQAMQFAEVQIEGD